MIKYLIFDETRAYLTTSERNRLTAIKVTIDIILDEKDEYPCVACQGLKLG